MLDHHIQRTIVYTLALHSGLRFSELKPEGLENKLFDYHLKKVVSAGYVEKLNDGSYSLTGEGRRLGVNVVKDVQKIFERAHSVIFLVIRDAAGKWLLYKRKNHPLIGKYGFMHITPNAEEEITTTAQKLCLERTGLHCSFAHRGSGYFRIYNGDDLESFTHFDMLVSNEVSGELVQNNEEFAEYFWTDAIDETDSSLLPNMPKLLEQYRTNKPFFVEKTIML